MKGPPPLHSLFDELRDILESCEVAYAVMGGIASSAWGLPRFTYDVDVAVDLKASDMEPLLRRLEERGFVVPSEVRKGWTDQLAGTRKFAVKKVLGAHVWDVDVFLAESEFLRSALSRRRVVALDGRPTPLVTPEDLILLKLVAGRPKDLGDIDDLLLVVGPLDDAYLRRWSERLRIRDGLDEALRRSGRG